MNAIKPISNDKDVPKRSGSSLGKYVQFINGHISFTIGQIRYKTCLLQWTYPVPFLSRLITPV